MRWTIKPLTFIHQHHRQQHHLMLIALRTKKLLSSFPCARHHTTSLTTQSYLIVLRNLPQSTTTTSDTGPLPGRYRSHIDQEDSRLLGRLPFLSTALMSSLWDGGLWVTRKGSQGLLEVSTAGSDWGGAVQRGQLIFDAVTTEAGELLIAWWCFRTDQHEASSGLCLCALYLVSGVILLPKRDITLRDRGLVSELSSKVLRQIFFFQAHIISEHISH